MPSDKKLSFAFIQMLQVGDSVEKNLNHALDLIRQAVKEYNPKIVALPECFNSPYGEDEFNKYAEYVPSGNTCVQLSNIAKELKIYLIGGTIPERDPINRNTLYNTATVWGPDGKLLAKHRKVHLYDVDITDAPVPESFHESSTLTPGNQLTTFEIEGVKFGVLICFDIYFDEFAKLYRKEGCDMLIYPAAFNPVIGPLHWDLLIRARATDNQVYVATISPARDDKANYVSWGYSTVADPFGRIIQQVDDKERIMYQVIDFAKVGQLREQIPLFNRRRTDIYNLIKVSK